MSPSTAPSQGVGETLPPARRWLVLLICCLSLLIVGIDVTIVNVALPAIQGGLHPGVAGLQWAVDAYTLVLASLMLLSGSTADRLGRRRTFQLGLLVFTVGSLACSLAPSIGALIAFRMVQAVGGSMLNPVALSIITNTFTDKAERARALGVWSAAFGLAMGLGPLVGGVLLHLGWGWRSVFWVNIPIGIAAIVLTALFVPESRAQVPRRPDPVGQVLVVVLLAALVYGIIDAPRAGWTSPQVIGSLALAAAALTGLVRYEPRRAQPLIRTGLFRSLPFTGACLITLCTFASFGGLLWANTLYLQEVRGDGALTAGLLLAPMSAMALVCGPVAGRLLARGGPRTPLVAAGAALVISALMLVDLTAHTGLAWLLAAYLVFGAGFALIGPPVNATALSGLPLEQAGVAAGIAATCRQVGQALGVAVFGSVVASGLRGPLHTGLIAAARPTWWILAGCGVAVVPLALFSTRPSPLRAAAVRDQSHPAVVR